MIVANMKIFFSVILVNLERKFNTARLSLCHEKGVKTPDCRPYDVTK